tara:strand:- start:231 stop:1121 length:891 start_codon:yes stop_codon:yes gene_type:complete
MLNCNDKILLDDNLDLTSQLDVKIFFKNNNVDQVYLTGGKSGGILANQNYPADFIYNNLIITANVINACFINNIKKILFVGSSCMYPKDTQFPTSEEKLLTGSLEPTNEPYSISKIAGLKLCESYNKQFKKTHGTDYRTVIPTNLYGPGDKYDLKDSHVISSLILRMHEAKLSNINELLLWGSGKPKREFLFIDDFADAAIFLMNLEKKTYESFLNHSISHVNVGSGQEISIKDLAHLIADVIGYKGKIKFDNLNTDGAMRKVLNISKISSMGWQSKTLLKKGLNKTYEFFLKTYK